MAPVRPCEQKLGKPAASGTGRGKLYAPKSWKPTSTATETPIASRGWTPTIEATSFAKASRHHIDDPGVQARADANFAAQARVLLDVQGSYGSCDSYIFFRGLGF